MSFGWSVGDIVAALQLLHNVIIAFKDTGGASSDYQDVSSFLQVLCVTLNQLKGLQAAPIDPHLARTLEQLCEQVHLPISSFCERIRSNFEQDLGTKSTKLKLLTSTHRLKWAFSTSKKVKDLQNKIGGPIAAISLVLSQQLVQTSLELPFEIQARIARTIDTAIDKRINPLAVGTHKQVTILSLAQAASSKFLEETIRISGEKIEAHIENCSDEGRKITRVLEKEFDTLSLSQKTGTNATVELGEQLKKTAKMLHNHFTESRFMSTRQSESTNILLRNILENSRKSVVAVQRQAANSREQTLSLHQKLNAMNFLMDSVKDCLGEVSTVRQVARQSSSVSEFRASIENIIRSIWLLISALQVLTRELLYLLAPYMFAMYRTSIQPLMLCGDHFLFEDAVGQQKWLPCVQFQHWDNFYHLLINMFQGRNGLSWVLNGQFVVLNGFNKAPITKKAWRAGIQPKNRVSMAMILDSTLVKKGRCADPSCPGQVDFGAGKITHICPNCRKQISITKDSLIDIEEHGSETVFAFDFASDIHMPISERATPSLKPRNNISLPSTDIAAFKSVIWQGSEEIENGDCVLESEFSRLPAWLTSGLFALFQKYPNDRFEGLMRYSAVNATTGNPCATPAAGAPTPEGVKYMYLPRIRCLDCPGKQYTPGPKMTVWNFEVHLKNRQHRARVIGRITTELQIQAGSLSQNGTT